MGHEDAVELGLGLRARALAVVEVDHRACQQPFRIARRDLARLECPGELRDPHVGPSGCELEVLRHRLVGE